MYYVITQTQKVLFATIDELFDYVNTHDDIISGFVGVKDEDQIMI